MSDSHTHERLTELFLELVDLAPDQRREALERECSAAPDLGRRLAAMLQLDETRDFLTGQAVDSLPIEVSSALAEVTVPLPERIGNYAVLRLLGEGGMGVVYLAEQQNPRRRVAVKVLRRGPVSADALRRFSVEAQVLGRLAHPGVARIFEAGTADVGGQVMPFLAMEFIEDARTLSEYVAQETPGWRELLELFAELCDAVHHGHEKGVVHRDLKPANILVDREGRIKVIDFGVARCVDDESALATQVTRTGQLIGTLQYMSPEQCGADPGAVDIRSDVYALGVILHELVVGMVPQRLSELPFHEALRVIREEPLRVGSFRLHADLVTILQTALEKEPERRYPSSRALSGDVRRHLAGEIISARPPSFTYQWSSFARRHRVPVLAGSVVLLTALVAAAVSTFYWLESEHQNSELSLRIYGQQLGLAHDTLLRGELNRTEQLLDEADPELRGWEWAYLHNQLNMDMLEFQAFAGQITDIGVSPDATTIVVAGLLDGERGEIGWFDASTGESLRPAYRVEGISDIGSLDKRLQRAVVVRDSRSIELIDLHSGEPLWATPRLQLLVESVHWNEAADQLLVVFQGETMLQVLQASTGVVVDQLDGFSDFIMDVVASPSGQTLAVRTIRDIMLVDAQDTSRRWRADLVYSTLYGSCDMAFAPDGGSLAVGYAGVICQQRVSDGSTLSFSPMPTSAVDELAWMPDGTAVATITADRGVSIIEIPEGQRRAAWRGLRSQPTALQISPDGRLLVTGTEQGSVRVWPSIPNMSMRYRNDAMLCVGGDVSNNRVLQAGWGYARLIDTDTGFCRWTTLVSQTELSALSIHPSDGTASLGDNRGWIHRIELDTGEVVFQSQPTLQHFTSLAHSPDGAILVGATTRGTVIALLQDNHSVLWSDAQGLPRTPIAVSISSRVASCRPGQRTPLDVVARDLESGDIAWSVGVQDKAITAMTWSTTGTQLAVALGGGDILVLDGADGSLLQRLSAVQEQITSLAFSPNGSRLLIGGPNGLQVWNSRAWCEVITLFDGSAVSSLQFFPDGQRVLAVLGSQGITVLETDTPAPNVLVEREHLRRLRRVVDPLFQRLYTSVAVVAALEADEDLDPALRHEALALAHSLTDNPNTLNSAAWGTVRLLQGSSVEYLRALAKAEAAVVLRPDTGAYWNTLGLAQLHVGQYQAAIDTFKRCNQANAGPEGTLGKYSAGVHPLDVLGLALAWQGLGRPDEALSALEWARSIMDGRTDDIAPVTLRFRRHAEQLIAQE